MFLFKKYLPYIAAFTYSSIFGFSFLFTKEGLEVIDPYRLLAFRFGLAALGITFLWIVGLIKLNFRGRKMGLLLLLSLVQPFFYFVFETLGIRYTDSSEAGLVISLIPVVVTVMAVVFLKEKPTKLQTVFILTSVFGVSFIMIMKGALQLEKDYRGLIFLAMAVLMGGIYNILSRYLSLQFKPLEITFIMMWSGAVLFNAISIINYKGTIRNYFLPLFNKTGLITVIYLGLFSSIVAFFMLNYTLARLEAHRAAVFSNLTTVISIMAGVFIRGEDFYWFQIIGGILIIIGVWGTNYFGKTRKRAKEMPVS
ncbi:MAG TPA: DMT family transporter [Halanaerobiales bacterium]|nr:DMT family transporter [Halanaerobiales bacterium]